MNRGFRIVGRVRRAHGIRGEMVMELHTDAPDAVFAAGRRVFIGDSSGELLPDSLPATVVSSRPFGKGMLVALQGVSDRSAAEQWRGRFLLVPEEELEEPDEGEVFEHELPGMRVISAVHPEIVYGEVVATYEVPQGLMLEVKQGNGTLAMLPFRAEMVTGVDRGARTIHVDVPEGLFDV